MGNLLSHSDLVRVFDTLPGLCLVLDTSFRILAQNHAHANATMTDSERTVGALLFELFPDNPNDSAADGLSDLRASLLKVMKTRQTDIMPLLRYAIKRPSDGTYEERDWRVTNTPL